MPEDLLSPEEEEEEEKEEEEETLETLKREIRLVRSVCSQHLILSPPLPPSPPCCDGGGRGTVKTDKATLYKRRKNLLSYCSVE